MQGDVFCKYWVGIVGERSSFMKKLFCSEAASKSKIYKKRGCSGLFRPPTSVVLMPRWFCSRIRTFSKAVALFFSVDTYYWHFKLPILPSHFQSSLRGHGGSLRNNNLNYSLRKQNILAAS